MNNIFTKLLTTKPFAPLLWVQFFAAFNDNFLKNALALLITYKMVRISPLRPEILITIVSILFVVPSFIFSAWAGQLADKFAKSKVIKIVKFCEILIVLVATYGFFVKSVTILLFALFLIAIQFAVFGPAKYALLPEILKKEELIAGNGLIDASTFIAILLGTILGGAVTFFADGSLGFIGVMMAIIAVGSWLIALLLPKTLAADPTLKIDHNLFASTQKIIKQVMVGDRKVFFSILGASWFWLFGFVILSQYPIFVSQILGASSGVVTLFLATFTMGIALGSVFCHRLMHGELKSTYLPASVLGMSLFLFDCIATAKHASLSGVASNTLISVGQFLTHAMGWRLVIDSFFLALCGGIYIVPIYVIMQSAPKKEIVSRVVAANNIFNAIFMTAGMVVVWLLLGLHMSLLTILSILAIINTMVALAVCKLIPDAVAKSFLKWVLQGLFKVRVEGWQNIKLAEGPYLVIANHNSWLDPPLIAAFFPKKIVFAINKDIAKKIWLRMLSGLVDLYPIDPTNPMATKGLIQELKAGNHVMIFPEGRITNTGSLMKIYDGPGLIALKSGARILPIRIEGSQYSYFSYLKNQVRRRLFPKVSLHIMPSHQFSLSDSALRGRERRQEIANQLYDLMVNSLFVSTDCDRTLFAKLLEARTIHGRYKTVVMDIRRKPVSYQKLLQVALAFARYLLQITQRKENVGVMLPNSAAMVGLFCGCQASARVPVLLNHTAGLANLLTALTAAQIKILFTSQQFVTYAKLEEQIHVLQEKVKIIYLEDWQKNVSAWSKLLAMLMAQIPGLVYRNWLQPAAHTDPAVVLFTSGSEGAPKGAVLSHKNLLANCAQIAAKIDFNSQDILFNALPNFHSFGLTGGMLLPLLYGLQSFYFPSPLQYRVIPELIYDVNATIMFGTDTFLAGYAQAAHPYDFYALRYVFAGAEKLRDETRALWNEKFGLRILEGYGATEASPIISVNTPMHYHKGTVGRLLPGIDYKLTEVEGIKDGKNLHIAGPNIALGYYTLANPGKVQYFASQWYNTGDIVTVDQDGFIKIIGRAKRFAKIAGEMVSLAAIEEMVANAWLQTMHAVISIPDEKKGEKIILVTTDKSISREALLKVIVAAGGTELMLPKEIIVVDNIPLLGTGKINYVEIKHQIKF